MTSTLNPQLRESLHRSADILRAENEWMDSLAAGLLEDCRVGDELDCAVLSPLPLAARASLFRDGIEVIVPSVRRVPPSSLTPRAKTHNYLNLIMGDLEVKAQNESAWAILLDEAGNLSEDAGQTGLPCPAARRQPGLVAIRRSQSSVRTPQARGTDRPVTGTRRRCC